MCTDDQFLITNHVLHILSFFQAFSFFALVTFGALAGIMLVTMFLMRQHSSEGDN